MRIGTAYAWPARSLPKADAAPTRQPSACTATWTDERVELLKTYWASGLSCSQIAKKLGGVTRNAVIGKASRMGLEGRATPSAPKPRPLKAPPILKSKVAGGANLVALNMARKAERKPEPLPVSSDDWTPLVTDLMDLKRSHCRWPIGDPRDPDFTFCGRPQAEGSSYCPAHHAVSRQPFKKGQPSTPNQLARALRRYTDPRAA